MPFVEEGFLDRCFLGRKEGFLATLLTFPSRKQILGACVAFYEKKENILLILFTAMQDQYYDEEWGSLLREDMFKQFMTWDYFNNNRYRRRLQTRRKFR
eukprot:1478560-Pleurochrysis_carterae.AAC.1